MRTVLLAAAAGSAIFFADAPITTDHPFGWFGSILIAVIGAFSLWRAGSVRAWKETAQGRASRIEDLSAEVAELRAELKIPERIEGIVTVMAEASEHADARAQERLDTGLDAIRQMVELHTNAVLAALEASRRDT